MCVMCNPTPPQCVAAQQDLIRTLGELTGEVRGVKEQVTRQNGNVARLTERMNSVESKQAAAEGADKAVEPWKQTAAWALKAAAVALLVLVLLNASHFLKVLGG